MTIDIEKLASLIVELSDIHTDLVLNLNETDDIKLLKLIKESCSKKNDCLKKVVELIKG